MNLKCISSGSVGNCYLLTNASNQTLILDCGVPIKDIQRGLNWDITHVAGCVISHIHGDHSKSIKNLRNLGIKVFTPYEDLERLQADNNVMLVEKMGGFDITAFQVPHNGTRNCGFLIRVDGQKILYLTDLEYCPYSFNKQHIDHMLIECNYIKDMVDTDAPNYTHKILGHCELATCKEFVKVNATDSLQNVILCHLGIDTSNADRMVAEICEVAKNANVDVARAGAEWQLRAKNECPF